MITAVRNYYAKLIIEMGKKAKLSGRILFISSLLLIILIFNAPAQESGVQYLSGTGADNTLSWDFYCSDGRNSKEWKRIEVPSCWEQQGYGDYNYGRDPFDKRLNEEGHYKYIFNVKEEWQGQQIDLVFEGVMTDCEIILNGISIGKHQGAFYEFSIDVSKVIKFDGKNLLEVKVKKHSRNESVNYAERLADYWIFGGIFRPVYLQVNPAEHIDRVAIDARADGSFKADIWIEGLAMSSSVEVSILDFEGIEQAKFSKSFGEISDSIRVSGVCQEPKLWSTEFPNRYIAIFKLLDKSNNILHQVSKKIGFRTVELRAQDGIYVNGAKTKFRGVNSHTFHPDFGRTSSEALSILTVNTMKDMNMNAIRFSHYPHDKHLLDACDSLGLFVLDELAGWQKPSYDTGIGRKLLKEMIKRDVNHPSVILWDNANEGGWNTDYDEDFGKLDIQKRELLHPWGAFKKTNTAHYITYDYLAFDHYSPRQIFFPTEFLHGLYDGGHGAGLDDYWQKMWHHPLSAGGFLWVLADEAVKRTDTNMLDSDGNHAPDGIVGPYFEKEGSFYAVKEIWSPVQIGDRYIFPEFDGKFSIENRFQFTHLDQCSFQYNWIKYSATGKREVIKSGSPQVPNLSPLERGILEVPVEKGWENADAIEITANDPQGRHIYTWSFAVSSPKKVSDRLFDLEEGKKTKFNENDSEFTFTTSNGVKISIGKDDGLLKSVSDKEYIIPFNEGPIIIDNDSELKQVRHQQDGKNHLVSVSFDNNKHSFEWTIEPSGLLHLDVKYLPQNRTYLAGIDFSFPESEMLRVKWMGNGPYRVWKNRMKGAEFGVWEKDYNNTITGHSGFEYPEFKGYHSNLYWTEITDKQHKSFRIYTETEDLFFKLYNPEEAPEPKNTTVEHSSGDISFLNGIPAIGTKFINRERLGPQSMPYTFSPKRVLNGKLEIKLIFDFSSDEL